MNEIGYACMLIGSPRESLRGLTLARATAETLREIASHNIAVLAGMIEYNAYAGIKLFRISSDIIPFASHPAVRFEWRQAFGESLAGVGRRIADSGQRVSMHPGQYTVLNSPDPGVMERAILDLEYHADFLDALNAPAESKIVLHVGGVYGDREAALKRFNKAFTSLPQQVKRRLALENDERAFAIDEVCGLAARLGVPAIMDVFHSELNPPKTGGEKYWLTKAAATWKKADGRQKIHYSQQQAGGRPGSHSATIDAARFAKFYASVADMPLDIMLEVKDKNLSALKCTNCVTPATPRSVLTATWARYKYAVLERSPAHYGQARQYLKAERPEPIGFYRILDDALATGLVAGRVVNAAEHVWGYFSRDATATEKKRFDKLLAGAAAGGSPAAMKRFLLKLSIERKQAYLLNSLYFDL